MRFGRMRMSPVRMHSLIINLRKETDKMKKRRLGWLILSLCWMVLIFVLSAQPGSESMEMSDRFAALAKILFLNQEFLMRHATLIVRKGAHMSEYGILAILLYQMFHEGNDQTKAWQLAFGCSVLYGVSDEFHQLFVAGRAGALSDVLIDACGGAIALSLWVMVQRRRKQSQRTHDVFLNR